MPGMSVIGRHELISIIAMRLDRLSDSELVALFNERFKDLGYYDDETDRIEPYNAAGTEFAFISNLKKAE